MILHVSKPSEQAFNSHLIKSIALELGKCLLSPARPQLHSFLSFQRRVTFWQSWKFCIHWRVVLPLTLLHWRTDVLQDPVTSLCHYRCSRLRLSLHLPVLLGVVRGQTFNQRGQWRTAVSVTLISVKRILSFVVLFWTRNAFISASNMFFLPCRNACLYLKACLRSYCKEVVIALAVA